MFILYGSIEWSGSQGTIATGCEFFISSLPRTHEIFVSEHNFSHTRLYKKEAGFYFLPT